MLKFIFQRLLSTLPVVWGVCTLTFCLMHFVPGDPVDIMLGDQASAVDKQVLRKDLGLDKPLLEQYKNFWVGIASGDLGQSFRRRYEISELVAERIPATAELTLAAMLMAILIGVPLGVLAATKHYSFFDNTLLAGSLLGISLPGFFLGPLLIWVFAVSLGWFPVSDRGGIEHLFLPALSLAIPLSAILIRITRVSMLEVVHQDYIRTAFAKGLDKKKVYFVHALKNAAMPLITVLGLQIGTLLTGTVITETIFDWPGIGSLLLEAISGRDYPLVQVCVLFIALTYVFVNFLTDISYGFVNPKVRLEQ